MDHILANDTPMSSSRSELPTEPVPSLVSVDDVTEVSIIDEVPVTTSSIQAPQSLSIVKLPLFVVSLRDVERNI